MITVYVQDKRDAKCKWCYLHTKNDDSTNAIRKGIEDGKLFPGDLAMTIHTTKDGNLQTTKVIKHWAIYQRHGDIEAVPDKVGVSLRSTSYRYYREYLKMSRRKALWYRLRKKKV